MEQTTQSPPTNAERTGVEKAPSTNKPLPSTEEDFHTRPSRTQSSGFRIGIDRDGDGYADGDELAFGSDPADSKSTP